MELRAHELAELLETLHELLIPSVFRQCLLGVGLELPDSLHVLWIAEQFLDLLVFLDVGEEVVSHPLALRRLQVVVHLHRLLDLLKLERIRLSSLYLSDLLLFRLGSRAEKTLLKASEGLWLFIALHFSGDALYLFLNLLDFPILLFLILQMPHIGFGIVLLALAGGLSILNCL